MTRLNKLDVGRGPYIPLCASCREIRYDPELFEDGNIIDRGNKRADNNAKCFCFRADVIALQARACRKSVFPDQLDVELRIFAGRLRGTTVRAATAILW